MVNKAEVNSINYSCALFITQCHESHLSIKVSTSVMIMPISLCTRHTVRRNFTYESESFYLELFLDAFFYDFRWADNNFIPVALFHDWMAFTISRYYPLTFSNWLFVDDGFVVVWHLPCENLKIFFFVKSLTKNYSSNFIITRTCQSFHNSLYFRTQFISILFISGFIARVTTTKLF